MQGIPFHFPELANMFVPDPGPQPYAPGQSYSRSKAAQTTLTLKPWPISVPSLNVLSSNAGTPHNRAPVPLVNQYSPNPMNYLFIAGFASKSKG